MSNKLLKDDSDKKRMEYIQNAFSMYMSTMSFSMIDEFMKFAKDFDN